VDDVLSKLLSLALANRCAEMNLSMALVGTMSDIDELIRWHVLDKQRGETPKLLSGWRADVCGDLLTDLLDGKVSLRVTNPRADAPLRFETRDT
jgi:ribonuclease D